MTNKEHIEQLKKLRSFHNGSYGRSINKAIEALEQESILDKIRYEIEENYGHCDICEYFEDYDYEENNISEYRYVANVKDILQIIDKYRGE